MLAVNGGAGYHSKGVRQHCKKKDIRSFICGYSSNLTKSERVKCKAVVTISDRYIFGGVSVALCLKNLVKVVHIIANCVKERENWELTPSMVISGKGINKWTSEKNFITTPNNDSSGEGAKRDVIL